MNILNCIGFRVNELILREDDVGNAEQMIYIRVVDQYGIDTIYVHYQLMPLTKNSKTNTNCVLSSDSFVRFKFMETIENKLNFPAIAANVGAEIGKCEIKSMNFTDYILSKKKFKDINCDIYKKMLADKSLTSVLCENEHQQRNNCFIYNIFKCFLITNSIRDHQKFKNFKYLAIYTEIFPKDILFHSILKFYNVNNSYLPLTGDERKTGFVYVFAFANAKHVWEFTTLFPIFSALLIYEYLNHLNDTKDGQLSDLEASKILLQTGTSDVLYYLQITFPVCYHNVIKTFSPISQLNEEFLKDLKTTNLDQAEFYMASCSSGGSGVGGGGGGGGGTTIITI